MPFFNNHSLSIKFSLIENNILKDYLRAILVNKNRGIYFYTFEKFNYNIFNITKSYHN